MASRSKSESQYDRTERVQSRPAAGPGPQAA